MAVRARARDAGGVQVTRQISLGRRDATGSTAPRGGPSAVTTAESAHDQSGSVPQVPLVPGLHLTSRHAPLRAVALLSLHSWLLLRPRCTAPASHYRPAPDWLTTPTLSLSPLPLPSSPPFNFAINTCQSHLSFHILLSEILTTHLKELLLHAASLDCC